MELLNGARRIRQVEKDLENVTAFSFVVTADPHAAPSGALYGIISALRPLPVLNLVCGDLTYYSNPGEFSNRVSAFDRFLPRIPTFAVAGDHDVYNGGGTFARMIGTRTFSIKLPNTLIYGIDTSAHIVSNQDRKEMSAAFQESDAKYKFLFTHIPPATIFNPPLPSYYGAFGENAAALSSEIVKLRLDGFFAGHLHPYGGRSGMIGKKTAYFVPNPNQYVLVTVDPSADPEVSFDLVTP